MTVTEEPPAAARASSTTNSSWRMAKWMRDYTGLMRCAASFIKSMLLLRNIYLY